jgi:Protein of unknown function (DUF2628)
VTLYSVYEPPGEALDPEERAETLVFVKEGFSWPALLVPGLWLLYQRMWLELILFVALFAVLGWAFDPSDDQGQTLFGWLGVALIVLFAFEANDLRGAALERQGYKQTGTAIGAGRDAAELAFLQTWLPRQERGRERQPTHERPGNADIPVPKGSGEAEGVIGLFPAP